MRRLLVDPEGGALEEDCDAVSPQEAYSIQQLCGKAYRMAFVGQRSIEYWTWIGKE